MKYVVVILSGAADKPQDALDGLTPLEAADTRNLDRLARTGRIGSVATTPKGFIAGSDVCTLDLLGYDPSVYYAGHAPLEAAGIGIDVRQGEWSLCLNLVTVGKEGTDQSGLMLDHTAGGIPDNEARVLFEELVGYWAMHEPVIAGGIELIHGRGCRAILVDRAGRAYQTVECTPPHDILDRAWEPALPAGGNDDASAILRRLMLLSRDFLETHEINLARIEQGLRPANMGWIWGQGVCREFPSFASRFGIHGAMITPTDLLSGIAKLIGWDLIDSHEATRPDGMDYAKLGRLTIGSLISYDLVCCHIPSPDDASHHGDHVTKIASLEAIDREIIGPLMSALERYGDPDVKPNSEGWRMLVIPDLATLCATRMHDASPVPFAMAGAYVRTVVPRVLSEQQAIEADLHIDPGAELMEYFLYSGLVGRDTK